MLILRACIGELTLHIARLRWWRRVPPPTVHCGEDANARDAEMSVPGAGRHPWAVREAAGAGRESASPVLSAGAPAGPWREGGVSGTGARGGRQPRKEAVGPGRP